VRQRGGTFNSPSPVNLPPESETSDLRIALKAQLPAVLCALTPAFCWLLIRPVAETGICDDWGYIKMAQVLAQSGHIVYNGAETPMLGWQLYLGALFVKLFGFSFTGVRLSTLVVAMATAFLLQRTFVRAGVQEWNATLATIALVLSPLFLPLVFLFMSDVSGLFCIVLCLYMCLRALRAGTLRSTIAWIGLAALSNALGGTARQIAWLGVLVMVPSTLWLLRRKPRILLIGGLVNAAGIVFVFLAMHWFSRQPYTLVEPLIPDVINAKSAGNVINCAVRAGGELALLLLPLLVAFVAPPGKPNRRMAAVFVAGYLPFALFGLVEYRHHALGYWLAPFCGDFVTDRGLVNVHQLLDERPVILPEGICMLLTVAAIIGLVSFLAVFFGNVSRPLTVSSKTASISWRELGAILIPFTLAYIGFITPRASYGQFKDRYLLPLLVLSLLALARYYQEKVRPNLPIATVVLVVIFGGFSVAATHDLFAMYRGILAAVQEIRASGVPDTAIDGNWEHDGWTELETAGYINNWRIRIPRGAYVAQPATVLPAECHGELFDPDVFPAIKPLYALSFDPGQCGGQAGFSPVVYHTLLAPRVTTIYIVKYPYLSPSSASTPGKGD